MRRDTRRSTYPNRRPARIAVGPTRHPDITAGQVALATAKAYGRWVRRSPDTRGLGTALVGLYPAGQVGYLANTDPLILAAFAPPAALAAWVSTYKAHHSRRYSGTITATAAGVPTWLAIAAESGIFHMPVLLGYTTAAALAWSGYTWSDVLKARRAWKAEQARWETIASTAGLDGSRLVSIADTRLGQCFRVDVRGTGKTARQIARGDLAERVAATLSLPAERVRVTPDTAKHAGMILIQVQTTDPWTEPVLHPALVGRQPALPSRRRSVLAGPLVIGFDPDSGEDLALTVFDKAGGRHTLIVAATGAGKTTLYSNVVDQATERSDVLVWAIDLGKGTIPTIWAPALDASAGIGEHAKALAILHWAAQIIEARSLATGGRNHKPSPTAPVILIPVDEMDTLIGLNSPIAHKAKPLVEDIFRRGRSAGVLLFIAGQRGTMQHTGSKDPHANAGNKIVLRVNRSAEMNSVVPDWALAGMPDMASYATGVHGVALVVDSTNRWRAGRIRDMADLDAVERLAAGRGAPTATLEPDIAAQLAGYADLRAAATHPASMGPLIPLPRQAGTPSAASPASGTTPDQEATQPAEPADAISRLAQGLVAEVEARLAGMPTPPDNPLPLGELLSTKAALDDACVRPVLELLTQRAEEGARRDELVAAAGRSESSVKRCLRALREDGAVVARGSTSAARYYLSEHAPTSTPGGDDDPEGDHTQ
jgi:hypothetical protein